MRLDLPTVRGVAVTKTPSMVGSQVFGYATGGAAYALTFTGASGRNVPLVQARTTLLLPATATVTAALVTTGGGPDLFYSPVPAEFFEVASQQPNAVVKVNGVNAECATNRDISRFKYDKTFDPYYNIDPTASVDCRSDPTTPGCAFGYPTPPDCSFSYSAARTPAITLVTTARAGNQAVAGDDVTIEGTCRELFNATPIWANSISPVHLHVRYTPLIGLTCR